MALILSRKTGESIVIEHDGKRVVVRVVLCGSRVRLMVDAPREVRVVRSEIERRGK